MTIQLPAAIAGYFEADRQGDAEAVATLFTDEATITDEGRTRHGRDAVRAWKQDSSRTYRYTAEPFAVESTGERTIVTSRVSGDFPGSPVDLRYFFTLEDDRISALEIVA